MTSHEVIMTPNFGLLDARPCPVITPRCWIGVHRRISICYRGSLNSCTLPLNMFAERCAFCKAAIINRNICTNIVQRRAHAKYAIPEVLFVFTALMNEHVLPCHHDRRYQSRKRKCKIEHPYSFETEMWYNNQLGDENRICVIMPRYRFLRPPKHFFEK